MYKALICRLFGHRKLTTVYGEWDIGEPESRSVFERCIFCGTTVVEYVEVSEEALLRKKREDFIRSRCFG